MRKMSKERTLLAQLKKQILALKRKEELTKNKLHDALMKIRLLGKSYKTKLANKTTVIKNKIAEKQASAYAKMALDLERQIEKDVHAKAKAIKTVLLKIEKTHAAKLLKKLTIRNKKQR